MMFKYLIIFMVFLGLTFVVISNKEKQEPKLNISTKNTVLRSESTQKANKGFSIQTTDSQETEAELIDMVQEYEHMKSDPEQRKIQREAMAEKLSTYSEQVLPVALEKMEERELNESD